MRVTWLIYARDRIPPIQLVQKQGILTQRPPWPTPYTHVCKISLHRLKVDIPGSVLGAGGYLAHIKSNAEAGKRFRKCMKEIFPE